MSDWTLTHTDGECTNRASLPGVFLNLACDILQVESSVSVRLLAAIEGILQALSYHTGLLSSGECRSGTARSVLAGDYMFARAFRVALSTRGHESLEILISLARSMIETRLVHSELLRSPETPISPMELLERGAQQTFSLLGRLSAAASGSQGLMRERIMHVGAYLGRAQQLYWEHACCESFLAGSVSPGLSDIIVTVPYQLAVQGNHRGKKGNVDAASAAKVLAESRAIEAVMVMANRNKEEFLAQADRLSDSPSRDAIKALVSIRMVPEGFIVFDPADDSAQTPWRNWLKESFDLRFSKAAELL